MAAPGEFAAQLKQQADIVRIIGEYVTLKRAGAQNFSGLCPFHHEKSPSFSVHATRQFFHCFGCGLSGDVYTFLQKIENITFPEAVRLVAQKLGVPMPQVQYSSPEEARAAKTRGALLDLHEWACQFFQQQLQKPEASAAREYLRERGLDEAAIERFRIGYAPDSGFLLRDALRGKASEELLRESGLFSWKDREGETPNAKAALYSKFRNRILFPICNERGKVIAFTGRRLSSDEKAGPKYLNSPETAIYSKSHVLYNLHLAKEAVRELGYMILVEGQMDCISVFNAGFQNVIATSGTAFTEVQVRLLERLAKKIVVNFDPDTAGAKAAERSLGMLAAEEFEIRVLTLEQGYDPDLFIRRKGAKAYADALRGANRYFDFLVERAKAQFATSTAEGKAKAVNYLLPHIQRVPSRIVRDELAANIAQSLQIDSTVLRQELRHVAGTRTATSIAMPQLPALTDAERLLLRALTGGEAMNLMVQEDDGQEYIFNPTEQARYSLETEHLHEGLASEPLFRALLEAPAEAIAAGITPASLEVDEEQRTRLAMALEDEAEAITPEVLKASLDALRRKRLEHELEAAEAHLAALDRVPISSLPAEQQMDEIRRRAALAQERGELLARLKQLSR
jgi:DNA primase